MLKLVSIVWAVALSTTALAQITPEEVALTDRFLTELKGIDAELESIGANQETLNKSAGARNDETKSLMYRYPGIAIPRAATTRQIYNALRAYRVARANAIRPVMMRRIASKKLDVCKAYQDLLVAQAELENTSDYKNATLGERLEMRKSFDELVERVHEHGDPCVATKPRQPGPGSN